MLNLNIVHFMKRQSPILITTDAIHKKMCKYNANQVFVLTAPIKA